MSLGRLIATLGIDSADWVQGLTKAEHQMAQFQKSVTKGMNEVVGNVATMAAAFISVGKAMEVFHKTVEYAAALDDLADAAGTTVEEIDKMVLSYNLIGISTEAAGKGILAFEKSLFAAGEAGSKQDKIFKALGVTLEKNADGSVNVKKAMDDTNKSLAAITDPTLRANAAMELYGKAGKELAIKMGDLVAAQKMAADQIALYGPITEEAAKAGEYFGVQMNLMGDALTRVTAPAMIEVTKGVSAFRDAFNTAGPGLQDFITMMADALVITLKAVASWVSVVVAQFKIFGAAIYMAYDAVRALASNEGLDGVKEAWNSFNKRVEETTQGVVDFNKKLYGAGDAAWAATPKIDGSAEAAKRLAAAMRDAGKEAAKAAAAMDEKWQLAVEALEHGLTPATMKSLKELNDVFNRGKITLEDYTKQELALYEADGKLIAAQNELKKLQEEENKQWVKRIDDMEKATEESTKFFMSMAEANDRMRDEVATIGMSNLARDLYISNMDRQRMLVGVTDQATKDLINTMFNERDALLRSRDASEQYQIALANQADIMNQIIDRGQSLFESMADGLEGISRWAKQAGQDLKRFLLDVLYQATLKPFIIQLVGASVGGTAATSAAGSVGSGLAGQISSSIASSALGSSISGALSGAFTSASAGAFSMLGGAGGAQAAALAAQTAEFGIAGTTATLGALGGAGAALSAALPVIGIALAGYMAFKMFKKKKVPHVRGYAETQGYEGAGRGGALDDALLPFIDETGSSYESLATGLGGTAGRLGFGIGLDTQKGKSSTISTSAMLNGQAIYQAQVKGGKTQEETDAALKQEASRVILSALQASDLPDDIAKIIDAVPAGEATQETIDKLLGLATAVAQINAAIDSLDDINATLDKLADDSISGAFSRQGDALRDMIAEFDGSTMATEQLVGASGDYYTSLIQLEAQIHQITDSITQMFADTTETILTTGKDAVWMVNHLNEDADAAFSQLGTATDPAKIQELAKRINADILAAWNLLTPEEQEAQRGYYTESIKRVDEAVGARLEAIGDDAVDAFKENMGDVKTVLIDAATSMNAAADKQGTAADTQLAAANTPITVVITPEMAEVNG